MIDIFYFICYLSTVAIIQIVLVHRTSRVLHVPAAKIIVKLVNYAQMHVHGLTYGLIVDNCMKHGQDGCAKLIHNRDMNDVNFVELLVDAEIKLCR